MRSRFTAKSVTATPVLLVLRDANVVNLTRSSFKIDDGIMNELARRLQD